MATTVHEGSKRGELKLAEDVQKITSLILTWSEAEMAGDSDRASRLADLAGSVIFGIVRVQSTEHNSHKLVLNLIQSGEDASKSAQEGSNSMPFVLAARLVRQVLAVPESA